MSDQDHSRFQRIARLDLARFERPAIPGNRVYVLRAAWYVVNALMFQGALLSLAPNRWKALVLRAFGARIGRGVVFKPRVTIKSPWFLEIGDHSWIGERVWIDNHTSVRIGANVCISQGAYIFTGNHDWNDPRFAFFCKPVEIGDGAWITAFQKIPPGTVVPSGVAVLDPPQPCRGPSGARGGAAGDGG